MRTPAFAVLLAVGALTLVAAAEKTNAPATVVTKSGKELEVFVAQYHYDKLIYALDAQSTQLQPMSGDQVLEVRFEDAKNTSLLRAKGYVKANNYDAAIKYFLQASQEAWYEWERIEGYLLAAEAARAKKAYDQAVGIIDDLVKAYPTTARLKDALYLKGSTQHQAGNAGAAMTTFTTLANKSGKMSKRMGALARGLVALGSGAIHSEQGKHDKAIAGYQDALRDLAADWAPREYAQLTIALGLAQLDAGKPDDALATFDSLVFKPVDPAQQGRAHLEKAQILDEQGKSVQAFDAAAFAYWRGSGDPQVAGRALKLARKIGTALGKDESLSPEVQKAYRTYVNKL